MWSLPRIKTTLPHWPRGVIKPDGLNVTIPNWTIAKTWALSLPTHPGRSTFYKHFYWVTPLRKPSGGFPCSGCQNQPTKVQCSQLWSGRSLHNLNLCTSYLCPWTHTTPDKHSSFFLPLYFVVLICGCTLESRGEPLKICPWRKGNW